MLDRKEIALDLLQKKRTIYLNEDITPRESKEFGMAMMWLNAQSDEEIKLVIDCTGGIVTAGLDMFDMIMFSNAPVAGIVYSRADSMASVILQACDKRYALPHARMLIHYLKTNEIPLNELDEEPEKALRSAKERQNSINEIYQKATGRSIEEIKSKMKENKSMTAMEALDFGLIDEIITAYDI